MCSVQLFTASEKLLPLSCPAHISTEQVTAKIYWKQIKLEVQTSMKTLWLQFVIPVLFILCVNGMSSLPTQPLLFIGIPKSVPSGNPPLLVSLTTQAISAIKDSIWSERFMRMVTTTILLTMDRLNQIS